MRLKLKLPIIILSLIIPLLFLSACNKDEPVEIEDATIDPEHNPAILGTWTYTAPGQNLQTGMYDYQKTYYYTFSKDGKFRYEVVTKSLVDGATATSAATGDWYTFRSLLYLYFTTGVKITYPFYPNYPDDDSMSIISKGEYIVLTRIE